MTRNINCENCMWGNQCHTTEKCEHYDPIYKNRSYFIDTYDRAAFEYEWQAYLHCWNGNDKWGDVYDG